jgi:glycosyltransferase involved in cell wall biosynthesis
MKKLVIIPTYNEKENIENIISAVFALEDDFHILVVDDSSPDGTADLVKDLQKISALSSSFGTKGERWFGKSIYSWF